MFSTVAWVKPDTATILRIGTYCQHAGLHCSRCERRYVQVDRRLGPIPRAGGRHDQLPVALVLFVGSVDTCPPSCGNAGGRYCAAYPCHAEPGFGRTPPVHGGPLLDSAQSILWHPTK